MVAYEQFVEWSQSSDSETRGQAAHLVAAAFIGHDGPADERAALYAALFGFLDDPSVKVRAALAYGLLRSERSPRAIMLAFAKDAPVIARAVLQYSPVFLEADLVSLVGTVRRDTLLALADREWLTPAVVEALIALDHDPITARLVERADLAFAESVLTDLAARKGDAAPMRGRLLARADLPAQARLALVEKAVAALAGTRVVKGAVAPERLDRLLRDALDGAAASIGEERAAVRCPGYVRHLKKDGRINTRLLINALVNGQVMFFADCIAQLSDMPPGKTFDLLGSGPRAALNAMFARCGMAPALRNLLARLVMHARAADLSDDQAARFFVVTSLIEELVIEHEGRIPADIRGAFAYLNEQHLALARKAARGVMPGFAALSPPQRALPGHPEDRRLALPAA